MADTPGRDAASPQPPIYRITIEGHLPRRYSGRFGDLTIRLEATGDTVLTGPVTDQAELHALLRRVRDLGMPLVSVVRLGPTPERASERLRTDGGGGGKASEESTEPPS